MTKFELLRPSTLDEALTALAQRGPDSKVLAGGQSLLLALKERRVRPSTVISIAGLPGFSGTHVALDSQLEIGPNTTYAELVKTRFDGWHAQVGIVAGNLADRSVRNMGTIGGAVCQAEPRYDMPTLLSAMAACFKLSSARGTRTLPSEEFFDNNGGSRVAADELLVTIFLPPLPTWSRVAFEKFRFRAFDAAVVNVAAAVRLSTDGTIASLRIVVGAVAKAPSFATSTAAALVGSRLSDLSFDEVATRVSHEVLPPQSAITRNQKYQSELTISLVKRVLNRLTITEGAVYHQD